MDFDRFKADTTYHQLSRTAPESNSAPTGSSSGGVDEETCGAYIEVMVKPKSRHLHCISISVPAMSPLTS
ncbi:MAG TPA: hypothetical protein VLC79_18165 [Cellvibrio sp.]|nr:hypothetical protein [Cellvibrio sp.]